MWFVSQNHLERSREKQLSGDWTNHLSSSQANIDQSDRQKDSSAPQQSQLVNQTLTEASQEKNDEIFSIAKKPFVTFSALL